MRIRITQSLNGSIDGIRLDQFEPGYVYDVGTSIGCYLMAMQAAEPVLDEGPALVIPLDQQPLVPHGRISFDTMRRLGPMQSSPPSQAADRPPRRPKPE